MKIQTIIVTQTAAHTAMIIPTAVAAAALAVGVEIKSYLLILLSV